MPAAEVHLLRDLFLGQTSGLAQTSEISTKGKQMGLRK